MIATAVGREKSGLERRMNRELRSGESPGDCHSQGAYGDKMTVCHMDLRRDLGTRKGH